MNIVGQEKLIAVFGRWPSFHDAEVLRITLERGDVALSGGPIVECSIHVFEMTGEVGDDGAFVCRNHTIVTFRFIGATEIELSGFNHQNALWDLSIKDISERQLELLKWEVTFVASFGMGGSLGCYAVEVAQVVPCTPDGSPLLP